MAAEDPGRSLRVIPQLGYDMRKFHEVKLSSACGGIDAAGGQRLLPFSRPVARIFNSGKLAGCVVSDELFAQVEKYAAGPDKGRRSCSLPPGNWPCSSKAGITAWASGGIHRRGVLRDRVGLAELYADDGGSSSPRSAGPSRANSSFDHDPATGFSAPDRINPEYLKSLDRPPRSGEVTMGYRISRRVHDFAFARGKGVYGLLTRIFARWDTKPGLLSSMSYWLEREAKHLGYGCQDCGDCSLPDCAYLCPMAGCSKHSRNGPCGGSNLGRCELDDKECFWARVYERLKYYGQSQEMFDGPPVLYDARLKHTSAWANTYLDRDHFAPEKRA